MTARDEPAEPRGFLQLCADRRYHRKTMAAFERVTGLKPDEYWVEARAGGAASWNDPTRTARYAHREGATMMGWAGHGDRCGGFHGESNAALRRRLEGTARKRAGDFPRVAHYLLFGEGGQVEVVRL